MSQVSTIYIFCQDQARHEQGAKQWPKLKGVFTDITPICKALQQAAQECDQNMISASFVTVNSGSTKQNLNQLDSSFMYTQIMKEILLKIDFNQQHIKEFTMHCRDIFANNPFELQYVKKLEHEYFKHIPVWWYTNQCFLYSMLNRSLRMMEIDLIISMGFFIRDLYNHIVQLHKEQCVENTHEKFFTVYRGQGLSQDDLDRMMKTPGGLLSFNNFLSTSIDRQISLNFARQTTETSNLVGILFVMRIDSSILSTPYANVRDVSYLKGEEEILFSMNSIFRIGSIKYTDENNCVWQVELTLYSDNDPDLNILTEQIRKETYPEKKGWDRLDHLLIKLGQFNKAQEVYEILFEQAKTDSEKALMSHMLGWVKRNQGEYKDAITYYKKSIKIKEKILSPTDLSLAASYNNIGSVYNKMDGYSNSLSSHQKSLEIKQNKCENLGFKSECYVYFKK
ncbi:unnamed protein product [Rotaria sp. Silwood2]|nr:unnamed protein product [Rotaria sp. Silwood2]CAF4613943.1 unnamed protein product [Rotaria sp. Silwood2]